ncbi:MAG: hypothetical protein CSA66_07990 [Proteobacteria bacterium]|nr:MAG: hypothetical protein CSA66_07990 [Pseudomonadota bacterium]
MSEWTKLGDWEYRRTPVIFQADGGAVRWHAFECVDHDDDPSTGCKYVGYDEYLALVAPPERTIAAVDDLASAPYIIDLTAGELADMAALVPLIGGKSAGIQAFNGFAAMTTPDAPAALTIRGYHEHLAPLVPALSSLIADEGFDRDPRVRLLALEGEEGFRDFYAGDVQSLTWLDVWLDGHQDGVVRQIVAQGGVERMIRDRPLDAAYEAEVRGALAARFAHLSPRQGLRFRSSATAEDVVGFNGAGLYDSNTGFFDPTLQPDGGDHKKTFAWAIRKTWASYWGFPAFEERRVAGIDHLEGNMGVLVHPRFDDDKEDANGVITFYLSDWLAPAARRMVVNVQDGALSVTNPAGGLAQPEVDVVTLGPDGAWVIERAQASSEVPEGAWVLSDGELATMAGEVAALARAWLAVSEERREPAERAESLVLDLELKRMLAGWPALANGHSRPGSLVYKQVRVLDSASVVPASLMTPWEPGTPLASMLPRDVATAADRIVALRCSNGLIDVRALRVWTRRAARDTFPFDEAPLVYRVWLRFSSAPQGWRWPVGQDVYLGHTDLASATVAADGGFTFALTEARAAELGFDTLAFDGETYEIAIRDGDRRVATTLDGCLSRTAFTSPAAFLEGIVAEADAAGAER